MKLYHYVQIFMPLCAPKGHGGSPENPCLHVVAADFSLRPMSLRYHGTQTKVCGYSLIFMPLCVPKGMTVHMKTLDQIPLAPFYKGGIRGITFVLLCEPSARAHLPENP